MLNSPPCRRHPRQVALVLLLAIGLWGCRSSSSTETLLPSGAKEEAFRLPNGVTVKVIHPNTAGGHDVGYDASQERARVAVGWGVDNPQHVEVVIDQLRLQVNGQDYGAVNSGDTVAVDMTQEGKVTVNDQERPRPTTPGESR